MPANIMTNVALDRPFREVEDAHVLAQAIVDTIREPLLVLDRDLHVINASRSYYKKFGLHPQDTVGRMLYDLGDGAWNIPALRALLERIVPDRSVMEDFEVEHSFAGIGRRILLLNARIVFYETTGSTTILLAIEDVTERRAIELALSNLMTQKDTLLTEMAHRIANSLQIIASILLMKARNVQSDETRQHLHDAHRRVMSVASVQQHLQSKLGEVALGSYLTTLCSSLADSMVGEHRAISLKVVAGEGTATSVQAVSLGLLATELVINALKHAFVEDVKDGRVVIGYEAAGTDWKLSVSDNGIGMDKAHETAKKAGLGTSLIQALATQLDAQVTTDSSPKGTTVSITHATFTSLLPTAA